MKSFHDQLGSLVTLKHPPERIISLVPSQTELLIDLGLSDQLVGVTKFCVHPPGLRKEKTIIGGTKTVDLTIIRSLTPDLIIGNKEENSKSDIEALRQLYPVWMTDIYNLSDAVTMIGDLGRVTGKTEKAEAVANEIRLRFQSLPKRKAARVLYLIWRKPWMAAGTNTFIDAMLTINGWSNAISALRYPTLTDREIESINPDLIFLSSEPYPFKHKHFEELKVLCPSAELRLVDGEMFSWYGSRLRLAPEYFASLQ